MAAKKPTATLSNGDVITVKTERSIAGTYYREQVDRGRTTGTLMRLDGPMFYVPADGALIKIRNDKFAWAETDEKGAELALAFFVEGAESCIAEAEKEGIALEDCY